MAFAAPCSHGVPANFCPSTAASWNKTDITITLNRFTKNLTRTYLCAMGTQVTLEHVKWLELKTLEALGTRTLAGNVERL